MCGFNVGMAFGSDALASPCESLKFTKFLEAMLLGMLTNGILHDELRPVLLASLVYNNILEEIATTALSERSTIGVSNLKLF